MFDGDTPYKSNIYKLGFHENDEFESVWMARREADEEQTDGMRDFGITERNQKIKKEWVVKSVTDWMNAVAGKLQDGE